jgi:hypothetical protein
MYEPWNCLISGVVCWEHVGAIIIQNGEPVLPPCAAGPAVYRVAIYDDGLPRVCYVGEAGDLARQVRLFALPKPYMLTILALRQRLGTALGAGMDAAFELLQLDALHLNSQLGPLDLTDSATRRLLAYVAILASRREGFEVVNR